LSRWLEEISNYMAFASRLLCVFVLLVTISLTARGTTIDLTTDQLTPDNYNPAKILATADKLIASGKEAAYSSLLKYAEKPIAVHIENRDDYAAWLCLLVYDPKPDSGLPTPLFGAPDFPDIDHIVLNRIDWPRFPLALNQGVPFLLVSGYDIAGFPEPGSWFIKRCRANGIFHTNIYPIPSHAEAKKALNDLISSQEWKALSWSDRQDQPEKIEFLRSQVERIK